MNGVAPVRRTTRTRILGAHPSGANTVIRTLRKGAKRRSPVHDGERAPMIQVHPDGIFAAEVPGNGARLPARRGRGRRPTTRTGTCPPSASSTCT